MALPVIPDVPTASLTVGNVIQGHTNSSNYVEPNADGSINLAPVEGRLITKFVQLDAQAITHATPVDVYTPTTGKKFVIMGYHLSTTVAGSIQFEDGTGNEVLRTPLLVASTPVTSGNMGNGIVSAAANTHLFLDVTVTGNVSGWIGIAEI